MRPRAPLSCGPDGYEDCDANGARHCYNVYCTTDDECGPRAGCETVMCMEQPCRRRCIRDVRPMRLNGPARGMLCSAGAGESTPGVVLFAMIGLLVGVLRRTLRPPASSS